MYKRQAEDLLYLSPELFKDDYEEAAVAAEGKVLEEREKYGQEELPPGAHKANKHYKPWLEKIEEKVLNPQNPQNPQKSQNPQSSSKNQAQPVSAAPSASASASSSSASSTSSSSNDYLGIPYSEIIQKWWQMYNDCLLYTSPSPRD